MMTRSQKIQHISRKWKDIAKLGLALPMRSDDDYWKAEDSSLEHQVTITILSTASTETENAHFVVSPHSAHASDGSAASILSDLANEEQLHPPRYSRSRRRLKSHRRFGSAPANLSVSKEDISGGQRPSLDQVGSAPSSLSVPDEASSRKPAPSLDQAEENKSVAPANNSNNSNSRQAKEERIQSQLSARVMQFVDSFNPLSLDEEPLPNYALIESFDSLSWGPMDGDDAYEPRVSLDSGPSGSSSRPKKSDRNKTEIDRNGFPKLL
ncbi:unnamed protein product [Cylindrotheca closterium]|uniref:Uncharacterized protein n=1 Tax=Cylindrotheca closterium TaxID=2856 RepID=A0AAD2JJ93_9STRA|nr:unnamed protein product [Cylindrotheca closterium]